MEKFTLDDRIQAIVSRRKLRLIPDRATDPDQDSARDHEFEVLVTNTSRHFTSFQVELLAPGLDPQAGGDWYTVEPEICAKKPPGAQTRFQVVIKKAPIPAYDTTLDLTLRVFSVEYGNLFTSQPMSLVVEKPRRSLRIFLPNKALKVFPGDEVEIPVILYNLDSRTASVIVRLTGLAANWMVAPDDGLPLEQVLSIEAGDSIKTSFRCCPPPGKALSHAYPFTVEVTAPSTHYSAREQGVLEVLPQGVVTLSCDAEVQAIASPPQTQATFPLHVENCSNQPQEVAIVVSESDYPHCLLPTPVLLNPGETQPLPLVVQRQRPWIGWPQRILFQVFLLLNSGLEEDSIAAVQPQPSSKTLELRVSPRIPPIVQIGSVFLFLLLLGLLWALRSDGHHSTVNFVRFSGDGTTVLSGSSDQTVRRWFVNRAIWQPDRLVRGQGRAQRLTQPDNIGDAIGKAVRVIRHGRKNNWVAVGLEDGTIQLWDTALTTPQQTLYQGTDRVFDLVFTQDSRMVFSGHGSGLVRRWPLASESSTLSKETRQIRTSLGELFPATANAPQRAYFPFAVAALALQESQETSPLLAVAGQFNRLVLWDWNQHRLYAVPYRWEDLPHDFAQPIVGKEQSIASLATAQNLLVTADNQGYITLWDLNPQHCTLTDATEGICDLPILDQWRDGHGGQPVRSVALTANGCYLASTGDDGRVMLWPLQQGRRSRTARGEYGIRLAQFPIRLNSVDLTQKDDTLLITSDGDRDRVMLYRVPTDAASPDADACPAPLPYTLSHLGKP